MAEVVTLVTGRLEPDRAREMAETYRGLLARGLPPTLEETFLVRGDNDVWGIVSIWRSRADLDALLAGPEEPTARRLIREAGGSPVVRILDVVVQGSRA